MKRSTKRRMAREGNPVGPYGRVSNPSSALRPGDDARVFTQGTYFDYRGRKMVHHAGNWQSGRVINTSPLTLRTPEGHELRAPKHVLSERISNPLHSYDADAMLQGEADARMARIERQQEAARMDRENMVPYRTGRGKMHPAFDTRRRNPIGPFGGPLTITHDGPDLVIRHKANPASWWSAGQSWLEREALKEAGAQRRAHLKAGRSASTFRYSPPEWQRRAVDMLGRNDEEGFKALKLNESMYRSNPISPYGRTNPAYAPGRTVYDTIAKRYRGKMGHARDYVEGYGYPVDFPSIAMRDAFVQHVSGMRTARVRMAVGMPLRVWCNVADPVTGEF